MDFSAIMANLPQYLEVLTQVVGVFALVATMTPNTSDNAIADFLLKAVNFGAANFGKSANGSDTPAS
tara:strand:+ start:302 stop:502 length:201 start_codon:yes stop_codon:yes gene_type:complete